VDIVRVVVCMPLLTENALHRKDDAVASSTAEIAFVLQLDMML